MNANQVKRVIGIDFNLTSHAALEKAAERAKQAIVNARRAGNDKEAARCSEAWQVLKNRLRGNSCFVCGVPINAGATKCRLHLRKQALAGPQQPVPGLKKTQGQPRDGGNPAGGCMARLGFYLPRVQKVVARWRPVIANDSLIEDYFSAVAQPIICQTRSLGGLPQFVPARHWQGIFELGAAISAVYNDLSDPAAWLLRFPDAMTDGRYANFAQIRDWARRQATEAKDITAAALKGKAKRMRLLSPANRSEKAP